MAEELGLNPKKLGSLDNHRQELWEAPKCMPDRLENIGTTITGFETG